MDTPHQCDHHDPQILLPAWYRKRWRSTPQPAVKGSPAVKSLEKQFACFLSLIFILTSPSAAQDEPWQAMDYGPFLSAAIEVTPDNIACKGIAIPLDDDGEHAMLFDTAELRWAAAWPGEFVELRGIVYDGPHGIWPRIAGEPDWINPPGPGVAMGKAGTFDDRRPVPYGPVEVGRWQGLQRDRDGVLLHYTLGKTRVFERAAITRGEDLYAWKRSIQLIGIDDMLRFSLISLEDGMVLSPSLGGPKGEFVLLQRGKPMMAIDVDGGGDSLRVVAYKGRVVLMATSEIADPAPVHIHIAPITGQQQLAQFRAITERVYFRDPSPLASAWNQGSAPLWSETITLAGERNAIFGDEGDADLIVRSAGAEAERIPLPHRIRDLPQLFKMDGTKSGRSTGSTEESIVVVSRVSANPPPPLAGWDCDESSGEWMTSVVDGVKDLKLEGVTWRRGVKGRALDFDGTARAIWTRHDNFEFIRSQMTFAAWIQTTKDGSIFSQTAEDGPWIQDGKSFFIRDGQLCFDIGWVGMVTGERNITDGRWHHVAFTWDPSEARIVLYVDGKQDGEGALSQSAPVENAVIQIGFTSENFPEDPWFSGYIDGIRIHGDVFQSEGIQAIDAAALCT